MRLTQPPKTIKFSIHCVQLSTYFDQHWKMITRHEYNQSTIQVVKNELLIECNTEQGGNYQMVVPKNFWMWLTH